MVRNINHKLFKSSSNPQYTYCFPQNSEYVRTFDKQKKIYIDIHINDIKLNDDSTYVLNLIKETMPYSVFVKFAKKYCIEKDMHDYPVDSKYANRKNFNSLVYFLHDRYNTGYFEKKLFEIITRIHGKSNLLFLDYGKKEDFEKLFY
jgi:hypothetical protein